jgi:hypothetical protein
VPGACGAYGLTGAIVLGEQLDGTRAALGARGEGRIVFAGDHECVFGVELVGVEMATAGDAMDVMVVVVPGGRLGGRESFSFALGECLFSFHVSPARSYEIRWMRARGFYPVEAKRSGSGSARIERMGLLGIAEETLVTAAPAARCTSFSLEACIVTIH